MKNLVIIIGTIILGVTIVTTLVLGNKAGILQTATSDMTKLGISKIQDTFK